MKIIGNKQSKWLIIGMAVLVLAVGIVLFAVCHKNPIPKPPFETQEFDNELCSFEIPADWEPYGEASNTGQLLFVPSGADTSKSVSNVSVNLSASAGKKASLEEMYEEFRLSFEDTVTEVYPQASDFYYSDYEAPNHTVFQTHYTVRTESTTAVCTQYYPLLKNAVLVVTATDVGDEAGDEVEAIAQHIVNTFQEKK